MLLSIREKAQSWIMWVIIIFLILMFGMWGISYYLTGTSPSERSVAVVNGQSIPYYRYQSVYHFLKQKSGLSAPTAMEQTELKQQTLQQLINKTLMVQQAKVLSMGVSQQDVNNLIYQLPAFQSKDGKFDPRLLQMYLQSMGMNIQEFQKSLLDDLMVSQLTRGISLAQFILPTEARHFAQLASQTRDISYHIIPARNFYHIVTISSSDIEAYYRAHQQDFMTIPRTKVAYIELNLDTVNHSIKPNESELLDYYQNHMNQFRSSGKRKGNSVLISSLLSMSKAQLTTVAQQVAKDLSQDKPLNQIQSELTAQHIILSQTPLDWAVWHKDQNAVHAALFKLDSVGQISQPIDTDKGIVLVKLTDMQPGKLRSYDQVKQDVLNAYVHDKARQKLSDMANQLANITFEHNRGLDAAANALNVPIKTTDFITQKGPHNGILADKKVLNAVFSHDVLVQGNNSDLIQLSPQEVVVVRAKDYQPAHVKPLSEVRSQINATLVHQDSTRLALHAANEYVLALQKGHAQHHADAWKNKQLTRQTTEIDNALLSSVFNHGIPKKGHPLIFTVKLSDGNAAVVKLISVHNKPSTGNDEKLYYSALSQLYSSILFNGYVTAVKEQAKIKKAENIQSDQ